MIPPAPPPLDIKAMAAACCGDMPPAPPIGGIWLRTTVDRQRIPSTTANFIVSDEID
ncbi:hypothetical protein DPMN_119138 [Dreissena polymorpha]|uniref:Uncharacterized protein n=1 Tax=Dreissena polymorpha TaxID=45954 RepID=A0A9D4GI47_DREPO|nr:hypothetical protein DPMN_119138 [Dreissena polymorpha]